MATPDGATAKLELVACPGMSGDHLYNAPAFRPGGRLRNLGVLGTRGSDQAEILLAARLVDSLRQPRVMAAFWTSAGQAIGDGGESLFSDGTKERRAQQSEIISKGLSARQDRVRFSKERGKQSALWNVIRKSGRKITTIEWDDASSITLSTYRSMRCDSW